MLVTSLKHAKKVFARICVGFFSIDTETLAREGFDKEDALVIGRGRVKIFSMCRYGESYSFPTNLFDPSFPSMTEYAEALLEVIEDNSVVKVLHNANYDINVLDTTTCLRRSKWIKIWDTMIGCWMSNMCINKGLKDRAPLYGRSLGSLHIAKSMQKKGFNAVQMEVLPEVAKYAEEDVITTDEIYQMQRYGFIDRRKIITWIKEDGSLFSKRNPFPCGKIKIEGEGLDSFRRTWLRFHEFPYLKAVLRAEKRGVPYSRLKAATIRIQCAKDKDDLVRRLFKAAGESFNLNSTPQLVAKLFKPNGIDCPYMTKKGNVQLNAAALFKMRDQHPLIDTLEKYKSVKKLQEVYIGDPKAKTDKRRLGIEYYLANDGRIRATQNTVGAVTGRGSVQNPNLTQIPSQADIYHIKDNFISPKGQSIVCNDYAQMELRIGAIYSRDPAMCKILSDPEGDIHTNTSEEFGVDRDPTAKQINFLLIFGGHEYALSEKLTTEGVPTTKEKAAGYIDRYGQVYYRVPEWRQELLQEHQEKGKVRLLTGRTRWLEDVDWDNRYSVHKAETTLSNNVVQGAAQDMLKASIIRCDPYCTNVDKVLPTIIDMPRQHRLLLQYYSGRIEKIRRTLKLANATWILQIHDECLYLCDENAAEEVGNLVAEVMTWKHFFPPITPYCVPLVADGGSGKSWEQAKGKNKKKPPLAHWIKGFNAEP